MPTVVKEITNSDDLIDVRDIIARVEYLEDETEDAHDDSEAGEVLDLRTELEALSGLLEELKGCGGDEQWRGNWYPITLVRDSYFEDFAQEEAESLDLIKRDAQWPYTCINWEQAAEQLQQDYSTVEFGDVTYWYR